MMHGCTAGCKGADGAAGLITRHQHVLHVPNSQESSNNHNWSQKVFQDVYKVSPNTTTHRTERFCYGVWRISLTFHLLAAADCS